MYHGMIHPARAVRGSPIVHYRIIANANSTAKTRGRDSKRPKAEFRCAVQERIVALIKPVPGSFSDNVCHLRAFGKLQVLIHLPACHFDLCIPGRDDQLRKKDFGIITQAAWRPPHRNSDRLRDRRKKIIVRQPAPPHRFRYCYIYRPM